MPQNHKYKTKEFQRKRKKQRNQKTYLLEETLGHNISPKTLFFCFLCFFLLSSIFLFFISPVADKSFRV